MLTVSGKCNKFFGVVEVPSEVVGDGYVLVSVNDVLEVPSDVAIVDAASIG